MTIRVTPEPDGSFTVSCGGETITVGIPDHIDTDDDGRGGIKWPDAPEGSPHGVRAYLAVGAPRWLSTRWIPDAFRISISSEYLPDTDYMLRHLEYWLRRTPNVWIFEPRVIQVTVPPGKSIDIAPLMSQLNGLAKEIGIRLVVFIEYESTGATGPSV